MPDQYDLQARYAPAALTVMPLVFVACVLIPDVQSSIALPATFAVALFVGMFGLLARVARARGRDCERRLFLNWGGMPTTAMLRHRDNRLNPHTKARYHERLRMLGEGFHIPTAKEEKANPERADQRYASAVDELRRRAKLAASPAAHRENISYGFARNLFALRPLGVAITIVALVILAIAGWLKSGSNLSLLRPIDIALGAFLIMVLILWFLLVTPRFVKHQAEAYAQALLETAELIKRD